MKKYKAISKDLPCPIGTIVRQVNEYECIADDMRGFRSDIFFVWPANLIEKATEQGYFEEIKD